MGIRELALFVAAQQLAQATAAYLGGITPMPSNPWLAGLCRVGHLLAQNAVVAFQAGIDAASAEAKATRTAEATASSSIQALPPIT